MGATTSMDAAIEQRTMRKVYLRLLPFVFACYFLCYLDRINVGFAALTMNKDLGLDAAIFGMAAGAFFWGYCLFEVPSNLILEKIGARIWIARIMVTWGILSGATAFCTGPWSFMIVRFLLGVAEAGLYPGMVLFFTYWFPDRHRARIIAGFTLALPIAVLVEAAWEVTENTPMVIDRYRAVTVSWGYSGDSIISSGLDWPARAQRPLGPRRLEMDVSRRGGADRHPRRLRHLLSHR